MQIKIGTRKSPLAIKQTELACELLNAKLDQVSLEIVPIATEIDSHLNYSLENQGGVGLFTKELDQALLDHSIDIAVHSSKDLPIELNPEISLLGYLPRASASDVLITNKPIDRISRIATSSPRRREQVKVQFPEAQFSYIRGNIQTRLNKVSEGEADATLLAEAGLDRLGIHSFNSLNFTTIDTELMVPAAGQGAIALVSRKSFKFEFNSIFCKSTERAVRLEKNCLAILDGGCQSPAGAYFDGSNLHLFHPGIGYKIFNQGDLSFENFQTRVLQEVRQLKNQL